MKEGAGIKCCECDARPYPLLSLPTIVRRDFDMLKIRDRWRCSQHRKTKIAGDDGAGSMETSKKPSSLIVEIVRVDSALGELSNFLASIEHDESEDDRAASVPLETAKRSLARLRELVAT
jgi:hypothetical protein